MGKGFEVNDFNKEELTYIRDNLKDEGNLYHDIYHKIEDLIHNYCDHIGIFNDGFRKHCFKCGNWFRGFLDWMEDAKWILPPTMTLEEARQMYERKCKEEAMYDR